MLKCCFRYATSCFNETNYPRHSNSLWEIFRNQSNFDFGSTTPRFHATYSMNRLEKHVMSLKYNTILQIVLLIKITSFAKNRMDFAGKRKELWSLGWFSCREHTYSFHWIELKSHPIIIIQWLPTAVSLTKIATFFLSFRVHSLYILGAIQYKAAYRHCILPK